MVKPKKIRFAKKIMLKNKKAFIFSIIITIFFILIINQSKLLISEIEFDKDKIVELNKISKERNIEQDIAFTFLKIQDISLQSIYVNGNTTVLFSNFSKIGPDYQTKLELYKNFTEINYSKYTNIPMNLTNFNTGFTIYPFDSKYSIANRRIYLNTTTNYANISRISVVIKINGTYNSVTTPTSSDSSKPIINITIIDQDNQNPQYIQKYIDPTGTSTNEFSITNTTSGNAVKIYFGQIASANGIFMINSTNWDVEVSNFSITYKGPANISIFTDATISLPNINGRIEITN